MKTNETGRSMVEMLGVLAIIGVLSIGGIAGYVTAMNRYRGNEILDAASKYATIVYTSCQTKKTMSGGTCAVTDVTYANSGFDTIGGVLMAPTEITDASVTIQITCHTKAADDKDKAPIVSESVCKAAASALGESYSDNKFSYKYKMS